LPVGSSLDRRQQADQMAERAPRLPRTSSSGSGSSSAGIMLLPVLSASDSLKNRCSSPQKMIRSSPAS
jgi:hypothetical protein